MAYRDNVSMLAAKLGISNDPSLDEKDLKIFSLVFYDEDGAYTEIRGTDMNRGSRLFFQDYAATEDGKCEAILRCDEALKVKAAEYFAELWDDPERGKRRLLDALRTATSVVIHWKIDSHLPTIPFDAPFGDGPTKQ